MSIRYDLSGVAGFDQLFQFSLTYAGVPLNLTGFTLELVLKESSTTPDALGTVFRLGSGLTMTAAAEGEFEWDCPAAGTALAAPGALWYRVDVIGTSSVPAPAMYGALNLTAA